LKKFVVLVTIILVLMLSITAVNAQEVDVWKKAQEEGVQFRAVGNNPEWLVEIRDDEKINLNYS